MDILKCIVFTHQLQFTDLDHETRSFSLVAFTADFLRRLQKKNIALIM